MYFSHIRTWNLPIFFWPYVRSLLTWFACLQLLLKSVFFPFDSFCYPYVVTEKCGVTVNLNKFEILCLQMQGFQVLLMRSSLDSKCQLTKISVSSIMGNLMQRTLSYCGIILIELSHNYTIHCSWDLTSGAVVTIFISALVWKFTKKTALLLNILTQDDAD